jgi:hypothetical protein
MNRNTASMTGRTAGIPRASGDEPGGNLVAQKIRAYSPRERG